MVVDDITYDIDNRDIEREMYIQDLEEEEIEENIFLDKKIPPITNEKRLKKIILSYKVPSHYLFLIIFPQNGVQKYIFFSYLQKYFYTIIIFCIQIRHLHH